MAKQNIDATPFEYQKWKIIGDQIDFHESSKIRRTESTFSLFIKKFFSNFWGTLGIAILLIVILSAIILPFFSQEPNKTNVDNRMLSIGQDGHLIGTDKLGRDLWARLWTGVRVSLLLSLIVTTVDLFIGVTLGLLMGKFERFDKNMQYLLKVITNIPVIILMIIFVMVFGSTFWVLAFSMTITGWTGMAQQIRSQTKRVAVSEWNEASKMLGTPKYKQTFNLLPHLIPMFITQLVFTIPGAITSETGLAFIGLSLNETATLGTLISDGVELVTLYPRYVLIPSSILVMIVTSIQFIGNTTQEALRKAR